MLTKVCTTCKEAKPTTDFSNLKSSPDGLAYRCKLCAKAYQRAYYERNKEAVIAGVNAWAAANPDKVKQYAKKKQQKRWREDPDKVMAAQAAWKARNPDIVASQDRRRKIKRKLALTCAVVDWNRELDDLVFREADELRLRRKRMTGFDWHVDHIVPLRAKHVSGLHTAANIAVVPASYNCSKRNKFDESYIQERRWL